MLRSDHFWVLLELFAAPAALGLALAAVLVERWVGGAASVQLGLLILAGGASLLATRRGIALARSRHQSGAPLVVAPAGQPALIRSANDQCDQSEAHQSVEGDQLRPTQLLMTLLAGLRTARDPQSIVGIALQAIVAHTGAERASVVLIDPNETLEYAAAIVGERVAPLPRGHAARVLEHGLAGWALRYNRTAILADVARDDRWVSLGARAPRGSAIVLPLSDGQAAFGVLTVTHNAPNRFANQDLKLFESVAACISLALNAAQGRIEEQSWRNQALSLLALSQYATSERSLADLTAELLDKSGDLFDASHMALFLPQADTLALADMRFRQPTAAHTEALMNALSAAARRAWRDRTPVTEAALDATDQSEGPLSPPDAAANLICLALPLLHNGAAVGVFALVCRAQGTAVFPARAWSILTILANVAAAAFANRQMIEQLHRRAELLEQQVRERTSQLQLSRDLLRVVFDHLPDGLVLLDAESSILAANDAFCREVIELPTSKVIGRQYPMLAQELEQRAQLVIEPRPDDPMACCARRAGPDGRQIWYEVNRYPVASGSGAQVIERWRDITRQEDLQRQLLLHEQLASLGRLAASVVHEVGNPLQSVRSCLDLCREGCELPEQAIEYLDLAGGELERMAHILAQLRDLYRPKRQVWEHVDLNDIAGVVQRITTPQLRRDGIKLELCPSPNLPPVEGQPSALHQVLLNLVLNAAAAMPDGGVIAISTQADASRRMCCVSVADPGVGMSPRQLSQIFEPFTTDTPQELGLGLYLSHQIIQQHRGTIDITSTVNLGTTVTIYLPWSEENDEN